MIKFDKISKEKISSNFQSFKEKFINFDPLKYLVIKLKHFYGHYSDKLLSVDKNLNFYIRFYKISKILIILIFSTILLVTALGLSIVFIAIILFSIFKQIFGYVYCYDFFRFIHFLCIICVYIDRKFIL